MSRIIIFLVGTMIAWCSLCYADWNSWNEYKDIYYKIHKNVQFKQGIEKNAVDIFCANREPQRKGHITRFYYYNELVFEQIDRCACDYPTLKAYKSKTWFGEHL